MDAVAAVSQRDKVIPHLGEDDLREMIECHLLGIDSMLEFAHRAFENWNADDTMTFDVSYDDMSLLDFAICDLERRVKDLRPACRMHRSVNASVSRRWRTSPY